MEKVLADLGSKTPMMKHALEGLEKNYGLPQAVDREMLESRLFRC